MTKNEKIITVCEVLMAKLHHSELNEDFFPVVKVTDIDLKDCGLSYHAFAANLSYLDHAGFVETYRMYPPIETAIEKDHDDYYEIESLQQPYFRFEIYAKGDLWRVVNELDRGVPFENISGKKLSFDKDRSFLEVNGYSIKIARQTLPPVEHYILAHIFDTDLNSEHGYNELLKSEVYDQNTSISTYINACKTLNAKIEKDTKGIVKDFVIYSKVEDGSVKINPKYIAG